MWYIHTYIIHAKMADEVSDQIANALSLIVNMTEQSGNMKEVLKQTIFETVSTLRNLFVKLRDSRYSKTTKIRKLEMQVTKLKAELEECSSKYAKVHRTPSLIHCQEAADTMAREHVMPSLICSQEPAGTTARRVTLPGGRGGKLYSEAVGGENNLKRFKLTVKSRDNHTPEKIKELLKAKINPTEIKVGINTFKSLKNGKVLIETNSKEEIEVLEKDINVKCRVDLEANIHTLRKPRLIILNIPEDISTTNHEDTLLAQNPDLKLQEGDIVAKFSYKTKKQTRNLVMEMGAQTSKLLI